MPELMAAGSVRLRENLSLSTGRPQRRQGFEKLLTKSGYNNEDYHDQMLGAQFYYGDQEPLAASADDVFQYPSPSCLTALKIRDNPREYVTLIFEVNSTTGYRKLIIGTQSRLVELDEFNGSWRILADGLGGPTRDDLSVRFRAAQLKDTVIFTNDYDPPLSYKVGDRIQGCDLRATRKIADLETIKLTRAKEVAVFGDCIFLLNVVLDGGRNESAYIWSDLNDGTAYDPARLNSIAALQSLPFGNRILRAGILLNQLVVYASRGIFSVAPEFASSETKTWTALFESPDGSGMLVYPSSLVNSGDAHYYMGADGIYKIDRFSYKPERMDWLHKASGLMFSELNAEACGAHVGGYWSQASTDGRDREKELRWSWAKRGSEIPYRTLCVQPDYKHVDVEDHGYTAFGTYRSFPGISAKDFFRNYCVCSATELSDDSIKEGRPIHAVTCEAVPTVLVTNASSGVYFLYEWPQGNSLDPDGADIPSTYGGFAVNKDLILEGRNMGTALIPISDEGTVTYAQNSDGAAIGIETEDYDAVPIAASLCAALNGITLGELCPSSCPTAPLFVAASARDRCLKQLGDCYSREICVNSAVADGGASGFAWNNAQGIYDFSGYDSRLTIGPVIFKDRSIGKTVRNVLIELEAEPELNRNVVAFRIGWSYSFLDPIKDDCGVTWSDYLRAPLVCPQRFSPSEYKAKNLRPAFSGVEFPVFRTGRCLYFEILVTGLVDPANLKGAFKPCVGGASSFSSLLVDVRKA